MQVPLLILDTLDELGTDDFKRFRWNLTQPVLDGCQPIRKGHLENADKQDTISRMIDSYGEQTAVNITVEILRRMNYNNAAQKLKQAYAGGSTGGNLAGAATAQNTHATPPSSSSSSSSSLGLTPAAGASVCAQGKSVIVAPNISGTSSGVSINMNINTQ
ncbi:pyrin-like isoform X4 [Epinephelus moara]|uniref:pyrin-like isoform X4 n=1 Tax=Epinephelus moara TaxID=300413 RepID=UPI00214E4926|nr:pyrin-like isoform X4 [Epinephelus moara]